MDDLVTGESTIDKAYDLYERAKVMLEGGFRLRKWKTNDKKLKQRIEKCEQTLTSDSQDKVSGHDDTTFAKVTLGEEGQGEESSAKVLGLLWDSDLDKLKFDLEPVSIKTQDLMPTQRNLKVLPGIFDPLGIIGLVVVSMKMLFQELFTLGLGWDDKFKGELEDKWKVWMKDLQKTGNISIDRCVKRTQGGRGKEKHFLHGCGDASKKGYCAVVYLVTNTNRNYR